MRNAPRFSHMRGRSALPWRINVIRARMVVTWHRLVFKSGLRQWFMKSFSGDALSSRFLIKSHRKRKVPTYNVISGWTTRLVRLSGSVLRNSVIYIVIVSLPTKRRRAEAFARCNVREHGVRVAAFEYRVPALNARNSRDYRYRDNVCRTCHWGRQTGWNRNRAAELVKSPDMLIRWPESNILKGGERGLRVPRMRAQSDLILIYVFGRKRTTSAISAPPPRRVVYHGGSVLSNGASMPLATIRLISLQCHPGALCVGEHLQQ